MKLTIKQFVALALFGLLSSAGACDDGGPDILSNSGSNGLTTSRDVAAPDSDSPTTQGPRTRGDTTDANNANDATREERGDTPEGETCAQENECQSGLGCIGGTCSETGKARISAIWEADTDLDLHVFTPSGEELYYRNREGANGGRFLKDGCIDTQCDGAVIEAVKWMNEPPAGTYEFHVVNYDGKAGASVTFEVRNGTKIETFSASVGAAEGSTSETIAVTLGEEAGKGEIHIDSHEHEQWVRGPDVNLTVKSQNDAIELVSYHATDEDLGESESGSNFAHTARFTQFGETKVKARGMDANGQEVDHHEITMVVMNANNGLPNPANGAVVSERLLAKRLLNSGATLYGIQVSGRNDGADARSNMEAAASNQQATNSCYGNAPCGRTNLNPKMLQAMVNLLQVNGYTIRVTSMAGGSHSGSSRHYGGHAFDADTINGKSVSSNRALAREFIQACRDLGAVEALGPGDAGHSSHVHCAW